MEQKVPYSASRKVLEATDLLRHIRQFQDPCDIEVFNRLDRKMKLARRQEIIDDIFEAIYERPDVTEEVGGPADPRIRAENDARFVMHAIQEYVPSENIYPVVLLQTLEFVDLCRILRGLRSPAPFL